MITITTEKVGGIDRVIITANDFNLPVIGAPDNPLALLRLVNSGGDVTGYYRYIASDWVFVGYGLSNLNEASGSPSGGIDLSSLTPLSLPLQPTDKIPATRDGVTLGEIAFSDLQDAVNATSEIPITANRDALLSDANNILTNSTTNNYTVTIQSATVFIVNQIITKYRTNTGTLSFAAGAGVTFQGTEPTDTQYGHIGLRYRGGNVWAWV